MKKDSITLSVILPAFNEEALLDECIRKLHATLQTLGIGNEIIIVNDGSNDGTREIATALAQELPGVTALHQSNQGIGSAFRTGTHNATGDYVMLWPVDMPAEPVDLLPYVTLLGQADVIVGVRKMRLGYNLLMRFNAWLYPKLVTLLFDLRLRDINWIHAYRREALNEVALTQSGIPMLVETLVRLRDRKASFVEIDVAMKPRLGGTASASRPKVMWQTLQQLLVFWNLWRQERRT